MESQSVVSVGTSATAICTADQSASVWLLPEAGGVFVGGSTVTTSTGIPLMHMTGQWSGGPLRPVTLRPNETLYGIVGSGTVNVRVLVSEG